MSANTTNRERAAWRIYAILQKLVAPHRSFTDTFDYKRIQLLNSLSLILIASFTLGITARPNSFIIFDFLLFISIVSYLIGKSRYAKFGLLVFSVGLVTVSYLSLLLGTTNSYSFSVSTIVPVSLIIANVLTSRRTFSFIAIYATVAAFAAPLYSQVSVPPEELLRTGGVIMTIGALLYGIVLFRESLENLRLEEVTKVNQDLKEASALLEQRVEERTRALHDANLAAEKRSIQLQTISELSLLFSANITMAPQALFMKMTRDISEKFNYYHVGIFLIDEHGEYAVLRAANSEGGLHMLANKHQLKVGGTGIVGYASLSGTPRIALDTGSDAVFFNNPDLPKTRSEMAIPLKYGTRTIGVLDIQSTLPSAFNEGDVNSLSALANQIAIIVRNSIAGSSGSTDAKSMKTETAAGFRKRTEGYAYLPDGSISSISGDLGRAARKAVITGETVTVKRSSQDGRPTLSVPVRFRDQVIGIINIESSEASRNWTEDEIVLVQSISDRAALALENARLFDNATRRAEQEETISRVTSLIGTSTDFDRIMQTTIQELGLALGTSRSFIKIGSPSMPNERAPE